LLTRAGWRSSAAVGNYGTLKSVASLMGLLVGLALVLGGGLADGQPALQLVAVMVGAFLGGMLPEFVVQQLARRRQKRIKEHLADAVDLMIIAANAGQSLDMSLGRVAEEMSRRAPALGEELTITISELRGMSDRRQPLENLAKRTDLREVKSVTATLVQTLRYGTPLTQSLKNLAREMREARMLALEEKAAKLPALLSLPLMLFIMPAIFVVTAGPAVLAIAEAFSR
jgi:tight adherence protein C